MKQQNKQVLRELTGDRSFKYCILDIEAAKWTNFKMMGFYDGKEFKIFKKIDDFVDYFLQRKYAYWRCFAHFGGGYDFNFLLDTLSRNYSNYYEILSSNGASMIRVRDKTSSNGRSWYFLDSYKLLPAKLARLTQSFDTEHKKLEINFETDLDKEEAKVYLEHDCKGLYEVIQKYETWFKPYGVPLKPTTASQAMALYRKMMPINIPLLKPEIETFVRQGYHGGRTEVFRMLCEKDFYYYDVCSLYPHVMKTYPMPVGTPHKVYSMRENRIGFYKAEIKVPDLYFPPLPVVQNQKLLFPIGKFSGTYSSVELEKAIEMGCDVQVDYGYVFPEYFIFDEYVDTMYEKKANGTGATREIAKLMLNSLYGKFGQNRDKVSLFRAVNSSESKGFIPYNEDFGLYEKHSLSRATFIIPSIASWITANARMELLNWLIKSGENHAYYCDTDSVVSDRSLPTSNELGKLKLEYIGNKAVFLAPKTYAINTGMGLIKKAKGFDYEMIEKLSFNDYFKALNGDKSAFVQQIMRFAKFKESLKRNGTFVSMVEKKKSIQSDYDKRTVLKDFNTIPLKVSL